MATRSILDVGRSVVVSADFDAAFPGPACDYVVIRGIPSSLDCDDSRATFDVSGTAVQRDSR